MKKPPPVWCVAIVEGAASALEAVLNQCSEQADIRFVLPNGLNRWTIIGVKKP